MFLHNASRIASVALATGMLTMSASSTFALPPQQVPIGAKLAEARYACGMQCASHPPPGVTSQQAESFCASKCQQLLTFSPNPAPTPFPGGGISNCTLSLWGNWAFYGTCQVIWTVTTSGLGDVTSLVASLLGGNTQVAQSLVNAAKGQGDPCGFLKAQIDAEYAASCQ
jgi:hypothetical protein